MISLKYRIKLRLNEAFLYTGTGVLYRAIFASCYFHLITGTFKHTESCI